jgi:hypothetical protein
LIREPSKKTFGALVGEKRLLVPRYQRSFSWGKEEAGQLWDDLGRFIASRAGKADEYFLGALVATEDASARTIVDGQQRMATLTVLVAAIRDALQPLSPERSVQIHWALLQEQGAFDDSPEDRMVLGVYDSDLFSRCVVSVKPDPFPSPPDKASHRLLREVQTLFATRIQERLAAIGDDDAARVKELLDLHDIVARRLVFVLVTTDSEADAGDVFETLNDRGAGLTTLDLLRNFLLTREASDHDRDRIVQWWSEVFDLSDRAAQVQAFLRHFWISRYGDVKARSLYREMRATLAGDFDDDSKPDSPVRFSNDLSMSAHVYEQLLGGATDSPDLNAVLGEIRRAGASALYPALLASLEEANALETCELSKKLLAFYVRWSIIGRRESTVLEGYVLQIAARIRAGERPADAWRCIPIRDVGDTSFVDAFSSASLTRPGQRRYILEKLEGHLRLTKGTGETKADLSALHVEHLYPQTPSSSKRYKAHDEWVHRIGNLTLILGRWNSSIKNGDFKTKKLPKIAASEIRLNDSVRLFPRWTQQEIRERQEYLATLAPKVWEL